MSQKASSFGSTIGAWHIASGLTGGWNAHIIHGTAIFTSCLGEKWPHEHRGNGLLNIYQSHGSFRGFRLQLQMMFFRTHGGI